MNGEWNILDLLFIAVLFFSIFFGLLRGLARELLSLFFLLAALAVAFIYYAQAGLLLNRLVGNRDLANFSGFLLILTLAAAAGSLFTSLVGKHMVVGPLKAIDRLLGAVFGLLRGLLISGLVIYSFLAFPLNQELLDRSQLAPVLTRVIVVGMQVLPPSLRDRLKLIRIHDQQKNNRDRRAI
jgi:membrane protein required for colicin V production